MFLEGRGVWKADNVRKDFTEGSGKSLLGSEGGRVILGTGIVRGPVPSGAPRSSMWGRQAL